MRCVKNLILISLVLGLVGCNNDSHKGAKETLSPSQSKAIETEEYRDDSTIEMANYLVEKYRQLTPLQSNYRNAERAEIFLGEQGADVAAKMQSTIRGAYELVNAGQNERAIGIYDELLKQLDQYDFPEKPSFVFNVQGWRGIANLRVAELENCQHNHNRASCLIPFQEEAYHKMKRGSEAAISDFTSILKITNDLNIKYLLNFAYMTLGRYPQDVPAEHLMPLSNKEVDTGIGRFSNLGSEMGIDDNQLSGGTAIDDFDGDGHYDIICSSWGLQDQLRFYRNNGDGTFVERHKEAGLKGITGGLNLNHADYDNDGDLDLFILRGAWLPLSNFPNSLLRNNGDGTFTDVTRESGVFSEHSTQTAAWADFNNDGFLDLFIGNESLSGSQTHPCELYVNQGDGTFLEMAGPAKANVADYVKGVCVADYDNDNDPDIFLSVLRGKNVLLRNDFSTGKSALSFTDVSEQAGVTQPINSFPCWFFDYDNNGTEDLFIASYDITKYNQLSAEYAKELLGQEIGAEHSRLFHNNGDGTFSDKTVALGMDKVLFAMGSGFGDMNNDGDLDMYIGTGEPDLKAIIPNRAFLNQSGKKFLEVTAQAGLGHVQKGHAVSFADLDQDGDEDIYAVMGGAYEGDGFFNAFFENPGNGNKGLKIRLRGQKSNHFGLGARIQLTVANNSGKKRTIHRTVSSGSSFGENPFDTHFGFLATEQPLTIKVKWPTGIVQTYSDLESGAGIYVIKEGENLLRTKALQPIKFKLSKGHEHHHH